MYRRPTEELICGPDEAIDFEWEEFEEAAESHIHKPDKEDVPLRRSIAEPPVVATSD
jgi:hypothetical protein